MPIFVCCDYSINEQIVRGHAFIVKLETTKLLPLTQGFRDLIDQFIHQVHISIKTLQTELRQVWFIMFSLFWLPMQMSWILLTRNVWSKIVVENMYVLLINCICKSKYLYANQIGHENYAVMYVSDKLIWVRIGLPVRSLHVLPVSAWVLSHFPKMEQMCTDSNWTLSWMWLVCS